MEKKFCDKDAVSTIDRRFFPENGCGGHGRGRTAPPYAGRCPRHTDFRPAGATPRPVAIPVRRPRKLPPPSPISSKSDRVLPVPTRLAPLRIASDFREMTASLPASVLAAADHIEAHPLRQSLVDGKRSPDGQGHTGRTDGTEARNLRPRRHGCAERRDPQVRCDHRQKSLQYRQGHDCVGPRRPRFSIQQHAGHANSGQDRQGGRLPRILLQQVADSFPGRANRKKTAAPPLMYTAA